MKLSPSRLDRRDFLRGAAATGAGLLGLHPALAANEKASPSEQIRIGAIGLGGQGNGLLGRFLKSTVAVCDVDSLRLGKAKERVEKGSGKKCAAYADFRKLLEDPTVDAVVIATPDHWHALTTVHACMAGKDVYCEKPLTLTIAEGRAMVNAARRYERIVQTGSQQRSDAKFRLACELVRNGRIGKVKRVLVGIPGVNFKGPPVPDSDPPAELDYDLWLGPAPKRPYNAKHVHYNFRFFWDYSGGQITNWGAHHLDITQWALGQDSSGPVSITGKAEFHPQKWYEVPSGFEVIYRYADGVVVECGQAHRGGVTFQGEKGTIHVNRGKLEARPADLLETAFTERDVRLHVSGNHQGNWLECIRSRKLPICDVEVGHRSATVCHLGNIAILAGQTITWDPRKEQVVGNAEAARRVDRPRRAPWTMPTL